MKEKYIYKNIFNIKKNKKEIQYKAKKSKFIDGNIRKYINIIKINKNKNINNFNIISILFIIFFLLSKETVLDSDNEITITIKGPGIKNILSTENYCAYPGPLKLTLIKLLLMVYYKIIQEKPLI